MRRIPKLSLPTLFFATAVLVVLFNSLLVFKRTNVPSVTTVNAVNTDTGAAVNNANSGDADIEPSPTVFAETGEKSAKNPTEKKGTEKLGSDKNDKNEEKEEEKSGESEHWLATRTAVFLLATLIIVISISFEKFKEMLEERTEETMKPILSSLFMEMTLLGFIGILFFVIQKVEALEEISLKFFGEKEVLGELFEEVHMVVFVIMVMFLVQVLGLVQAGNRNARQWREYEHDRALNHYKFDFNQEEFHTASQNAREKKAFVYKVIREQFIYPCSHVKFTNQCPEDFNFAGYLSTCTGHTLAEVVEVPVSAWVTLEIFFLVIWIVEAQIGSIWLVPTITVVCAYLSIPAIMVIGYKVRGIMTKLLPKDIYHSSKARLGSTPLTPLTSDRKTSYSSDGGHREHLEPAYLDYPSVRVAYPRCRHFFGRFIGEDKHSMVDTKLDAMFWMGSYGPELLFFISRLILLFTGIYLAVCILVILPILLDSFAWWGTVIGVSLLLFPIFFTWFSMPDLIYGMVVISHVEHRRNEKVVLQVLNVMKTKKVMQVLKMIGFMQRAAANTAYDHTHADQTSREKKPVVPPKSRAEKAELKKKEAELRAVFILFDSDGSGAIGLEEVGQLFGSMGMKMSEGETAEVMKHLDYDNSGEVSFDELFEWMQLMESNASKMTTEELVENIFALVDQDGDRKISPEELQQTVLNISGEAMSTKDVEFIVRECDEDGDGEIDFEEFATLLKKYSVF